MSESGPQVAPANQYSQQQLEAAKEAAVLGRALSLDRLAALGITLPEEVDDVIVTSYYDRGDLDSSSEVTDSGFWRPPFDELSIQASNIHGKPNVQIVPGFSMQVRRHETNRKRVEGLVDADGEHLSGGFSGEDDTAFLLEELRAFQAMPEPDIVRVGYTKPNGRQVVETHTREGLEHGAGLRHVIQTEVQTPWGHQ